MHVEGERRLAAARETVWRALNDPVVLRNSLPGCRLVEPDGENRFRMVADVKVGPVKATVKGRLALEDVDAPAGCRLRAEGDGGSAGFARGWADVRLHPDGDRTLLRYAVEATVGGRLARIGTRVLDTVARQLAHEFFANLEAALAASAPGSETVAAPAAGQGRGQRRNMLLALALAALAAALYVWIIL